jgi:hypothetical protein
VPDGPLIRPGDRIGVLHLNNARTALLHAHEPSLLRAGLEFRRQFFASLHALAHLLTEAGSTRRASLHLAHFEAAPGIAKR